MIIKYSHVAFTEHRINVDHLQLTSAVYVYIYKRIYKIYVCILLGSLIVYLYYVYA